MDPPKRLEPSLRITDELDPTGNKRLLRSIRARQEYWIERRDKAREIGADYAAGEAQRFIDEYEAFIETIEKAQPVFS